MADVELQVLGPVGCTVDGVPLPLGGARQRALVAYLALNAGRPAPIAHVVDDVWGAAAPRTVVKSLSTLVSRVRSVLAPHGIDLRFDDAGYVLDLPSGVLDLDRFRAAAGRARVADLEGDTVAAISHLRTALGCWRGEPLDGLTAPFVDDLVDQLGDERDDMQEELARLLVDAGTPVPALGLLEALVERNPFREDRWAMLVRTYTAAGRRPEALETYQRAHRTLRDEVGSVPGRELRAAEEEALTVAPAAPTAPASVLGAPPVDPPAAPRIERAPGREAELDILEREARLAAPGEMRAVVVVGEPGVGKSHLVRAFLDRIRERPVVIATGRCDPFGTVPLGPLLSLVEATGEMGVIDESVLAETPVLLDALSGRVSEHPIGDAGDLRRSQLLRELKVVMRSFSITRPIVVVVEDFHWADPLTVAALQYLAQDQRQAPVLFVLTAREPDLTASPGGSLIEELAQQYAFTRIHLGPLDREALREVVADALAQTDDPEAVLDVIEQGCGGNPLYARQLARHLEELESPDDQRALPRDLQHLMLARIRRVPEEARELLVLASVLGRTFTLEEVGRVFPDDAAGLARRAEQLLAGGLLERVEPDGFRFVHGLIRQAAYDVADAHQQALLHLAAATIQGYGTGPPDVEMVRHLLLARAVVGDSEVMAASLGAARRAIQFGAHEAALQVGTNALALEATPEQTAELHMLIGAALVSAGDHLGIGHLDTAEELARAAGRWDIAADALLGRARIARLFSRREAQQRADRIGEVLEAGGIGRYRRASLLAVRAEALLFVDPDQALAAIDAADRIAPAIGRPEFDRHVEHLRLGHRLATGGAPAKVVADGLDLVERCVADGDLIGASHSAAQVQGARVRAGLFRACVDDTPRLLEVAERSGRVDLRHHIASAGVSATMALEPLGVGDQASEALSQDGTGAGTTLSLATRLLHLWSIRREQRRLREMGSFLDFLLDHLGRPGAEAWVAAVRVEAGDLPGARALLEPVGEQLLEARGDQSQPAMLALLADLALDIDLPVDARRIARVLKPFAGQVIVAGGWVQVLGRADRYLGRLAQLRGDLDGAVDHFTAARHLDQASGAALWAGWAAHDEARARLVRGGPGDVHVADALLDGSLRTAKRLGARRLAAAIRGHQGAS